MPCSVNNLVPSSPLGSVGDDAINSILDAIFPLRISLSEKYLTSTAVHGERYSVTIRDYLAYEAWAQSKRLVCPEDYVAGACLAGRLSNIAALGMNGVSPKRVSVHAAYGGSITPLHFDWDFSHIHHLCIIGRRRLWLCPPLRERMLPVIGNSILADFEAMESGQREKTLALMGVEKLDLEPGTFVQFPSFWWHMVEYSEASVAVSMRSEIDPVLRPITVLPRSSDLQNMIGALASFPAGRKISFISGIVSMFVGIFKNNNNPFIEYSFAIRQCAAEMDISLAHADPWVVSASSVERAQVAAQFQAGLRLAQANAPEVELCRNWLFAHWPKTTAISHADASLLAGVMASAMSPAGRPTNPEEQEIHA